jgi:cation-transporting ATPase E
MYAALALLLTVPLFRDFFDFSMPGREHLAMTAGIALTGCLAVELLYRSRRRHLNTRPASTGDRQVPGNQPAPQRARQD